MRTIQSLPVKSRLHWSTWRGPRALALTGSRAMASEAAVANEAVPAKEVRDALIHAFTHGRKRMLKPVVLPVVDRARPAPPPDIHVEDLELCSEPDHPHGQGWVPVRIMWCAPRTTAPPSGGGAGAAAGPQQTGVAAALAATMQVTHTSQRAAFQVALGTGRSSTNSTPAPTASTPASTSASPAPPRAGAPGGSRPATPSAPASGTVTPEQAADGQRALGGSATEDQDVDAAGMPMQLAGVSSSAAEEEAVIAASAAGNGGSAVSSSRDAAGRSPDPSAVLPHAAAVSGGDGVGASPCLLTDGYEEPEGIVLLPRQAWTLTDKEQDRLAFEAKAMAQARAGMRMYDMLNGGVDGAAAWGSAGGAAGAGPAGAVEWREPGGVAAGHEALGKARPVVILMHSTGSSMNRMCGEQEAAARAGYVAVTMDCRYHGERVGTQHEGESRREIYQDALVRAWRDGSERPFLLDNLWDLSHLMDYLVTRPDVDPTRIGITGVSLGGMHAWLLAVADERVAVAAPMIGLQNFGWALEHDQWHERVNSLSKLFAAAASDMGKEQVDGEVVKAVWDKLAPGLLDKYDSPLSLPTLVPRPFMAANGELDPRCPMQGVLAAFQHAQAAYFDHAQAEQAADPASTLAGLTSDCSDSFAAPNGDGAQAAQQPEEAREDISQQAEAGAAVVGQEGGAPAAAGQDESGAPQGGADTPGGLAFGGMVPGLFEGVGVQEPLVSEEELAQVAEAVATAQAAADRSAAAARQAEHANLAAAQAAARGPGAARSARTRAAAVRVAEAAKAAAAAAAQAQRRCGLAVAAAAPTAADPALSQPELAEPGHQPEAVADDDGGDAAGSEVSTPRLDPEASSSSATTQQGQPPRPSYLGEQPQDPVEVVVPRPPSAWVNGVAKHAQHAAAAAETASQASEAAAVAAAECAAAAAHAEVLHAVNRRLVLYSEPGAAHEEKAGMWKAVRAFLDLHLRGVGRPPAYTAGTEKNTHPVVE